MSRLAYIDCLRGVAVLCMIEWHVLDSWSLAEGRGGWTWFVFGTIGGFAAPLFLFLAGVAVPLAIGARVRRGATRRDAAWSVQKRGWQVFAIAHLFRLQSFMFNPHAEWSGLLRPDILNVLGLSLVATAFAGGRATSRRKEWLWFVVPAVAILVISPFARLWWWPTLLHPRLEAYIRPVPNMGVFTLFPSVAYVLAGAWIGATLSRRSGPDDEPALHRSLALGGLAAVVAGFASIYIPSDWRAVVFVVSEVVPFLILAGGMTAALAVAWWLLRGRTLERNHPLLLFGRTSLFVYWVHVELAYGVVSYPLHKALPVPLSLAGLAVVTIAMYFAARWWERLPWGRPWIPSHMKAV